jgi:Protein of unknown function (DUF3300)
MRVCGIVKCDGHRSLKPSDCCEVGRTNVRKMPYKNPLALALLAMLASGTPVLPQEQTQPAATAPAAEQAPEPLSEEEMEILVARIALYPDDLVAAIAAASLYPLQIIEAQRFLDDLKKNKDLKPKSTWDGSVVSLLNYPPVVKMMSDDLDWTQTMGEAITNQEKDVMTAIQQLREKAVAEGIIKSDDKVKVVEENDNIVIQPAATEVIYVPQYEPAMLYDDNYSSPPIYGYYPDPYPDYHYPWAGFWAGAITGAIWGGIVDWDNGIWGGPYGGDFNCNNCFNNVDFNGKLDFDNVDWKNIDRSKLNKNDFKNLDRNKFKDGIKNNDRNRLDNKAKDLKKSRGDALPGKTKAKDVRAKTLDGLKKPQAKTGARKPPAAANRPAGGKIDRPAGKPKPAARPDVRPKNASPLGDVKRGVPARMDSSRGSRSAGGGMRRPPPRMSGGGRGGGGRGGRGR